MTLAEIAARASTLAGQLRAVLAPPAARLRARFAPLAARLRAVLAPLAERLRARFAPLAASARQRLWPERAWSSPRTASVTGWISCAAILAASGAVGVQARLDELAAARGPAAALQPVATMGPADVSDFVLTPEALNALTEDEARAWNAALPVSTLPILAARPFIMDTTDWESYSRALDCLTAAVHYEAANEPAVGQAAVAQVVLNRVRHPAYPGTVCGVVFQGSERETGCQFTFTCDGSLARPPRPEAWARARAVASAALNGLVIPNVGMATHYHADYVAPIWATNLVKLGQIGVHIFYRWTGTWGLPGAFTVAHPGTEPLLPDMAPILTLMPTPQTELAPMLIEVAEVEPLRPAAPEAAAAPVLVTAVAPPPSVAPVAEPMRAAAPAPAAPVLADPLARPEPRAERRRPRIAAPSSW